MKYLICLPVILAVFILFSCEQKSDYERLVVEQEMNKEIRHDSLLLGYRFGMEREEFFNHSWQLNQQQIVTGSSQIVYRTEDLSHPAKMVFYPEFHNNRIYKMPIEISFEAWAPWNRHLFSDSLITELVGLYTDIYGPRFKKIAHPEIGQEAWIKIDGNRRISIYQKDQMKARIEFLDLSVGNNE